MTASEATTEEKEHKQAQEQEIKAKKNVLVKSDEHAWLPARIVEQTEHEAIVQVFDISTDNKDEDGAPRQQTVQLRDYPPTFALPLANVNTHADMIDLPFLHEAGILYNLRRRFASAQPYTRTGDILIAVNPYEWLAQLYTTAARQTYLPHQIYDSASKMVKKSVEPHVYEISAMAYRGLQCDGKNQSILVSGESGAGKTETVKICLDHIATIQGGFTRPSKNTSSSNNNNSLNNNNDHPHQVMSSIVQRVVDSNPLLEAFGNAKTVRNDNSSRFGKFVQLQFDTAADNNNSTDNAAAACTLVGSHIEVYLLEKSRVVSHAAGERNFHIFYQLLSASNAMMKTWNVTAALANKTPASFAYLGSRGNENSVKVKRRTSFAGRRNSITGGTNKNQTNVNGGTAAATDGEDTLIESMSDVQWLEQTLTELESIGIQDEILGMLVRALTTVLQLGTIQFKSNAADHATVASHQLGPHGEFTILAQLMGIDVETLTQAFTHKTIMAGTTEISSPLSAQQAKEGCDAYAKDLYSKIFSWLVGTINAATSASPLHNTTDESGSSGANGVEKPPEHGMIGVLDIFGFEAFETNHFEQLCINYANERLQYMFASNVFVSLIDEYAREGLVVDFSYETNTNVLDLIAGKTGILATLNEECIRPGGSDVEFVYKALNTNKKSPRMFKTDLFTRYQFGIRHFAGPVVYTATDFLNTNKDLMPIDLQKVSRVSTNTIIAADITPPESGGSSGGAGPVSKFRSRGMNKNTVVSKFRTQLNSLMKTLSSTQTRYIRCIKPNRMKQPRIMENLEIMRQLSSGGVIAAVKIASASYPNKMEHNAVLKRFRNLGNKPNPTQDVKTQVSTLLATALKDFVSPIKGGTARPPTTLGKTRTYFRTGALEYLENARNDNIGFFVIIIQRSYRMAPIRRSFLRQRKAAVVIQAIMRGHVWKRRVERMPSCALQIQCWCRCMIAKLRLKERKSAVKIQRRWCVARELIRFERRTKAAIEIQRVARGSIQRPRFQKDLAQKTKAAIQLQAVSRGYVQLVKYRVMLKEKHLRELAASTQIQRHARGFNERIRFKKLKAAILIQRIARGHIQRKRFKDLRSAILMQRIVRGFSQRVKFKVALKENRTRKNKAAIHMQRLARGYVQLGKYRAIKKAEQERIAAEKAAEQARREAERLAAEKAAEEERIAAEKAAKEARLLAERLAEEERRAAEKRAEEERLKRIAAEKRAEDERLEAERRAEEKRLAEQRAEEARLEAKRRAEEERIAAEKRAAQERLEAERRAEEERLAAERRAEEERIEAERVATEKRAEEERLEAERIAAEKLAEEARLEAEERAEERRLAAATQREDLLAAERQAQEQAAKAEKVAADTASLEARLAAAEKRAEEERLKAEKLAAENAALQGRISTNDEEHIALEKAIQSAREKAAEDNARKEEAEKDEELELALEMALLAGQNPDAAPEELNKLLGRPTVNAESSSDGFYGLMAGGFRQLTAAKNWLTSTPGVITVAPWDDNDSLGASLGRSVGMMSRRGSRDDDTYAESVLASMRLPDSLTADQLRTKREKFRVEQQMRKIKKKISEKSRELRTLRTRGDRARSTNNERKRVMEERKQAAMSEWHNKLERLPYDDRGMEPVYTAELEEVSIKLGLGSFESQKAKMNEDKQLEFEVQILQEAQLVRQMQQMHVTGQQKYLHKKHDNSDVEYLKSCQKWLLDQAGMIEAVQGMERLVDDMQTMYAETLRRQEAAFARHDADMTIRESIEDIF